MRFRLTETPIENNLLELWSIFDFIMPGYLFSKKYFEKKFILNKDTDTLRLLVKPFILRRTKLEVAKDLPDKIEKQILVAMTTEQRLVYKEYISIKENRTNTKRKVHRTFIFRWSY